MSQSLSTRTVEFASGTTGSMPFNLESSNSYYYPVVQTVPGELGGYSVNYLAAAASTNITAVKASPGMLYGVSLFNMQASVIPLFITFYDVATTPVVDTTTIKLKLGCPGLSTTAGAVKDWTFKDGIVFSTGIYFALHSGILTSAPITATALAQAVVWYK